MSMPDPNKLYLKTIHYCNPEETTNLLQDYCLINFNANLLTCQYKGLKFKGGKDYHIWRIEDYQDISFEIWLDSYTESDFRIQLPYHPWFQWVSIMLLNCLRQNWGGFISDNKDNFNSNSNNFWNSVFTFYKTTNHNFYDYVIKKEFGNTDQKIVTFKMYWSLYQKYFLTAPKLHQGPMKYFILASIIFFIKQLFLTSIKKFT